MSDIHIQYKGDRKFSDNKNLWPFLRRLFKHAFQHKEEMRTILVTVIAIAVVDASLPLIWLHFLDEVVTPGAAEIESGLGFTENSVWKQFPLYFGLYLFLIAVIFYAVKKFVYAAGAVQEKVMYDLRKQMFNRLQSLSFSFYDRNAIGWLISRLTSDTERVTELISWGFLSLVWGLAMILFCFIAMLIYSWKLMLIVACTIPVLLFLSVEIRKRILHFSREARRLNSEITANFNEHINGVEVNKSATQEQNASLRFAGLTHKMQRSSYKAGFYTATYIPVVVTVGSLAGAGVVLLGGNLVLAGTGGITIGVLAAFFGYTHLIFEPIFDITHFYALAQSSMSAGERIFSLMDEKPEIEEGESLPAFPRLKGGIEFREVNFSYTPGKPILEQFNLSIRPGESIALVGPSGEGKTTISSLVCRFYEPNSGQILFDGVDYRQRSLLSLRKQLGVILQTPYLFSGTIANNIRFARAETTEAEMAQALQTIGAEDLIPRLQEEIGEEGKNLSAGEKQIIAFVRAMIIDPAILIMDEATSSIDTLAEARLQKGISTLVKGRTSIIIAHRLSTIKNCDRILVIEKGKITEEGTHKELMAQKGHYFSLYTRQVRRKAEI